MTKKQKTFYITTPIFYPSGKLHIGHFYTMAIAKTIKLYKEMRGYKTLLLTGSDEHGQKIQQKAEQQKIDPQAYVDKMSKVFIDFWKKLDLDYDIFMRTSSDFHATTVQKIFKKLQDKGLIYKSFYEGLYSIEDEEFFTTTQAVKKDDKYFSPNSGHELKTIKEESYFFKMSKFSNFIQEYMQKNTNFVRPTKIVKELTNNFLKKGLSDLSVTRTSFTWGVPVLDDKKHVTYVWIDALSNYISGLGYLQNDDKLFQEFWIKGDERVHIVGKEITRFHCLYWPIILKSLNLPLPTTIFSHGWIVTSEGKMSKSKGNVVDPIAESKIFSPETLQYFLFSQIPTSDDGTYDREKVVNVFNGDLANKFGNLVSRTIAMACKNFDVIPKNPGLVTPFDKDIKQAIKYSLNEYFETMDKFDLFKSTKIIMKLCSTLNNYIDLTKTWTLKPNEDQQLEAVITLLLNGIYAVGVMIKPIMPIKIYELATHLKQPKLSFHQVQNFNKFIGLKLKRLPPLFQRMKGV